MSIDIAFIGIQNGRQCFIGGDDIPVFCPYFNRLGHTADDIVNFQLFGKRSGKSIGNIPDPIDRFHIADEILITVCQKEFLEGHRSHIEEIHFSHWETACQGKPEQRTGAGNIVFRRVLTEIFQAVERIRTRLYFIEDQKRLRRDLFSERKCQIVQNPVDILGDLKKLVVFRLLVEIDADISVPEFFPEFVEDACFCDLSCAPDNDRFSAF